MTAPIEDENLEEAAAHLVSDCLALLKDYDEAKRPRTVGPAVRFQVTANRIEDVRKTSKKVLALLSPEARKYFRL